MGILYYAVSKTLKTAVALNKGSWDILLDPYYEHLNLREKLREAMSFRQDPEDPWWYEMFDRLEHLLLQLEDFVVVTDNYAYSYYDDCHGEQIECKIVGSRFTDDKEVGTTLWVPRSKLL